jgi:hypothetical protein
MAGSTNIADWRPSPVMSVVIAVSVVASTIHGYRRNEGSVGYALLWGAFGAMFPIVTPAIAIAEGFGEPEGSAWAAKQKMLAQQDWELKQKGLAQQKWESQQKKPLENPVHRTMARMHDNPVHCDLSYLPTDIKAFTPKQREEMTGLLSEQPVWWLRAKRDSLPTLCEPGVQRMIDKMFVDAIARHGSR